MRRDDEHVALQRPRRGQLVAPAGRADVGAVERQLDLGPVDQLVALDGRREERPASERRRQVDRRRRRRLGGRGAASVLAGPVVPADVPVSADADGAVDPSAVGSSSSSPHAVRPRATIGREGEGASNVHDARTLDRGHPVPAAPLSLVRRAELSGVAPPGQNRDMAEGREALFPTGVTILRVLAIARWLAWGWMVAVVAFSGDALRHPVAAWTVGGRRVGAGGGQHVVVRTVAGRADERRLRRRRGRLRAWR